MNRLERKLGIKIELPKKIEITSHIIKKLNGQKINLEKERKNFYPLNKNKIKKIIYYWSYKTKDYYPKSL